jgi:hypothetical protein
MAPSEQGDTCFHAGHVQLSIRVPGVTTEKEIRLLPVENPVFIGLGFHAVPGVEIKGRLLCVSDKDVLRKQAVESFSDRLGIHIRVGKEVADLVESVNPSVGSARGNHPDLLACEDLDFVLQNRLNGEGILLPLPAVVLGAVVCQHHSDVSSVHPSFPEKEKGSLCRLPFSFNVSSKLLTFRVLIPSPRTSHAVLFPFPHTGVPGQKSSLFQGQSDIRTETS